MRIAAMAAMLAVANGSTAFAGAQDNGFSSAPGGNGRGVASDPIGTGGNCIFCAGPPTTLGSGGRARPGAPGGYGNGGTVTGPGGLRGGGV